MFFCSTHQFSSPPYALSGKPRLTTFVCFEKLKLLGSMQTWWGGMAQARIRILALGRVLGPFDSFEALQESERPAKHLLEDEKVAELIYAKLSAPGAGKGDDELCQWMYDTYQTGDSDLQAVVLRYIPTMCGIYLPRLASEPGEALAGFEAVLLALYTMESKARAGRPLVVHIPNLSQPSLYHTPRVPSSNPNSQISIGQIAPPLEPQEAVKTTKRASIVGIALDLFCRKIAIMPSKSKLEFCQCARSWATRGCSWASKTDEIAKLALVNSVSTDGLQNRVSLGRASSLGSTTCSSSPARSPSSESSSSPMVEGELRIPLPWELLQPILKVLAHCLMGPCNPSEVKVAAAAAARALYARATHELIPEAILATRSLLRLDEAATAAVAAAAASSANSTPSKPRKPEILLTQS